MTPWRSAASSIASPSWTVKVLPLLMVTVCIP
jgi:hypothetical protein